MRVEIDPINSSTNIRGIIFEPIEKDSIYAQKNSHVVVSEPDVIRGNHYHLYGTETVAVLAPALWRFEEGDDIYDFEIQPKQVYKYIITPKVSHAIKKPILILVLLQISKAFYNISYAFLLNFQPLQLIFSQEITSWKHI